MIKKSIAPEWKLFFRREDGWWGMAEKANGVSMTSIRTGRPHFPTFETCYAALAGLIDIHEREETT